MAKSAESNEKSTSAADEAAKKTVQETSDHLAKNKGLDTHGAYNKLIDSVRTTHQALDKADPTGKTSKAYEQKVVAELEKSKMLPIFALEYGQRAFTKIDHKDPAIGSGDGRITAAEMLAFKQDGKVGVFGSAMLDTLAKTSDQYKSGASRGVSGVSETDLATGVIKHENRVEAENSNEQKAVETEKHQSNAKELKSYLFDKGNSSASLFERADFVGAGSLVDRTDKKVSKEDFVALASDPTLTAAQKKDLQEKVIDKWDDPAFQNQFVENGYMTENSIKKATGEIAAEQQKKQTEEEKQKAEAHENEVKAVKTEAQNLNGILNKQFNGASVLNQADFLGSNKDSERKDGLVAKHDLEALIKSPGFDPTLGKEIQEKLINKMDDPAFKQRFMKDGYIDKTMIEKASGALDLAAEDQQKWEDQAQIGKAQQEQEKIDADAKALVAERAKSAELAAKLLKADAGVSLIMRADYVGSSNLSDRTDGKVNEKDLAALAADPSLSQETKDFINENLIKKWKSPEVMRLQQGGYISAESLKALIPNS